MLTQIMVPLDGSAVAERALPCAAAVARACGATLHLVRVVTAMEYLTWEPVPAFTPPDVYEAVLQEATTYLAAHQQRLSATGLTVRTAVPVATVGASLLDDERDAGIDLVVLCSHGRTGLARFALGSVAERLLHDGAAPLLLVRAFGPPLALDRAVVPLDGSVRAEQALAVLAALAGVAVRAVTLLRMIATGAEQQEAEYYLAQIARHLPATLAVDCRVEQGDPAACIAIAAGATGLVVMATHGRMGVTRWALGSVADRVAHSGVAGVLLLRPQRTQTLPVTGERGAACETMPGRL